MNKTMKKTMNKSKNTISKKVQFITLALLTSLSSSLWAEVRAFVNQTTVYTGNPVTLTIEASGKTSGKPDLSVLQKDFQLIGTSTGSSTTIINGNVSSKKSWTITLNPKHQGEITIPAITVGNEKTAALKLQVTDVPAEVKAQMSEHVFLQASIQKPTALPYVQQQIPYTVKLFFDDTVQDGSLIAPRSKNSGNAIIEQIGEDKKYAVTQNGKNFTVLERHYVISPQKSGKLHIQPTVFKGSLRQVSQTRQQGGFGRGGLFDDFFGNDPFFSGSPFGNGSPFASQGKPITTASEALDIDVQAIPSVYAGQHWIPAQQLSLEDSWDTTPPEFHVGEPVTRTLILQAKGLAGSQLPSLKLPETATVRIYADQDEHETRTDGSTLYGILKQTLNYIPNAEGQQTLPAMTIDWWDVNSKQQRSLTLAARDIKVLPGVAGSSPVSKQPAATVPNTDNAMTKTGKKPEALSVGSDTNAPEGNKTIWWILGLALLLLALAYWLFKNQVLQAFFNKKLPQGMSNTLNKKAIENPDASVTAPAAKQADKKKLLQQLQTACETNQPQAAAKAILKLAKQEWPQESQLNMGAIAKRVTQGADEIRQLDQFLYAAHPDQGDQNWDGSPLWQALQHGLPSKRQTNTTADGEIRDLYPQTL